MVQVAVGLYILGKVGRFFSSMGLLYTCAPKICAHLCPYLMSSLSIRCLPSLACLPCRAVRHVSSPFKCCFCAECHAAQAVQAEDGHHQQRGPRATAAPIASQAV